MVASSAAAREAESRETGAPWLSGVVPPVCTPLDADLEVDVASLERLIGFLLDGGVTGLFVLGSSSEVAFLRDDQRDRVIEIAVKTVAGQVPLIAGVIDTTTPRVSDHVQRAVDRGVDGVVVTAPFYAQTTRPAELELHFRTVKRLAQLPVLGYDIPPAVHSKLPTDTVSNLARDGILDGIKDSSGDVAALRDLVMATAHLPNFAVFTGSEFVVDCAMLVGADGSVPGLGNVDPGGFLDLYRACRNGEWASTRTMQERLCRLHRITRCADALRSGPTAAALGGFKTALMLLGVFATNALALPQQTLDEAEVAAVRAILVAEGLL